MLQFTYETDREKYLLGLRAYQQVYQRKLSKSRLASAYLITLWVFIAVVAFVGLRVSDVFSGQPEIILSILALAALIPTNWYLTKLYNEKFTRAMVDDIVSEKTQTKVTCDEAGMQLESEHSSVTIRWEGVSKLCIFNSTLIVISEAVAQLIALDSIVPGKEIAEIKAQLELLSGISVETSTGLHA